MFCSASLNPPPLLQPNAANMGSARPGALSLGRHGNPRASTEHFPPDATASAGSELAPCARTQPSRRISPRGGVSVYEQELARARGASATVLYRLD